MSCRVSLRLQELIQLRNLEQKHQPMKSLLLDIDFRYLHVLLLICSDCRRSEVYRAEQLFQPSWWILAPPWFLKAALTPHDSLFLFLRTNQLWSSSCDLSHEAWGGSFPHPAWQNQTHLFRVFFCFCRFYCLIQTVLLQNSRNFQRWKLSMGITGINGKNSGVYRCDVCVLFSPFNFWLQDFKYLKNILFTSSGSSWLYRGCFESILNPRKLHFLIPCYLYY